MLLNRTSTFTTLWQHTFQHQHHLLHYQTAVTTTQKASTWNRHQESSPPLSLALPCPGASSFEGHYDLITTLEAVSQAPVFVVKKKGGKYIIKQFQRRYDDWTRPQELRMLLAIPPYPNIVVLKETFLRKSMSKGRVYNLVLEYGDRGDLSNFRRDLENRDDEIPKALVLHIFASIVDGLVHLHDRTPHILHGDIKPTHLEAYWKPQNKADSVDSLKL